MSGLNDKINKATNEKLMIPMGNHHRINMTHAQHLIVDQLCKKLTETEVRLRDFEGTLSDYGYLNVPYSAIGDTYEVFTDHDEILVTLTELGIKPENIEPLRPLPRKICAVIFDIEMTRDAYYHPATLTPAEISAFPKAGSGWEKYSRDQSRLFSQANGIITDYLDCVRGLRRYLQSTKLINSLPQLVESPMQKLLGLGIGQGALKTPAPIETQSPIKPAENQLQTLLRSGIGTSNQSATPSQPVEVKKAPRKIGDGIRWQDAKEKAETFVKQNGFPGVRALAKFVGCAPATMTKAIKRSKCLTARKAQCKADKKGHPRTIPMTNMVMDRTPQTVEPDLRDDAVVENLIAQSNDDNKKNPSPLSKDHKAHPARRSR